MRRPTGEPQLVSVEPLPALEGQICEWAPASAGTTLLGSLQQEGASRPPPASGSTAGTQTSREVERAPVRVIRDTFPTYSAVAVDPIRNEIVLQDENLFQIMVYDRMANTPPSASMTEPKRVIGGNKTRMEFNCGLYIDPKSGDIYSVNNDTMDTLVIFSREAKGNVPPDRELYTPHGTYGIAVDEQKQELFLTVEHTNAVVVYRKLAQRDEQPLRILQGEHTGLEDPHGIAVDTRSQFLFVTNHGNARNRERGGRFEPPSITVYPLGASGDTAPVRVIQGARTRLNWPAQLSVDEEHQELFVANDADDSVLVFRTTDSGDVAPARILRGPQTGLKNPTGVFVDTANQEIVVSNMGNHSATVYPRTASGDVAPLRTIRNSPQGKLALAIGNPGAAGYDSKREEILVPN
ncbi:MAG: hypothetical protein A3J28_07110 [Acidobacteria bacterium RIFCSPLOWO2_12_FULL_60_22]|nr:MAG: hypothetical protein A3J28_07110 [Acidobacteria bacterium RIFCSPLOWO2_12_FULL_60_22]